MSRRRAGRAAPDAPSSAVAAKPLSVRGGIGHLVAPGDRVEIAYTVYSGSKSVKGALYVRNDLQPGFLRLPLNPGTLRGLVPARLIRGHKLFYYAVIRDPRSGRSVTLPAAGARAPNVAWILERPTVIRLGSHRFGHTRAPEAVVAQAGPDEVGFENNEQYQFGPQTFLVGKDRSIWLHDGLNKRMLAWRPGRPDTVERSVPLPFFAAESDVALGPAGSLYVTQRLTHPLRLVLYRLSATGKVLWQSRLAGEYEGNSTFVLGDNSPLRLGPDGALYSLVFMGLPGDEWGWMPVATLAGRPLSAAAQRRGTHWPFQPVAGGLRLLTETYTPPNAETAPHETRFALIDRRGRLVRGWRVLSRTDLGAAFLTPELVGGDLVVALGVTVGAGMGDPGFKWEYEVLRLGPHGARARFSLPHAVWGTQALADLRVGPDGKLYQLGTSPATGAVISRYSLGHS